jgi:serine phosphatase RsbU (regulator of sigma subunit)
MFSYIKDKFNYISSRGMQENMSMSEQKKVILTNQLSLLMFFVLFFLMTAVSISAQNIFYVYFLLAFSILIVPLLNHKGLYRLTSFMMSVIFPISTLIISTVFKIGLQHNIDITNYFIARFLIIGGLIIPLVLIDAKHKWTLIMAVSVSLFCLLIYDPVCTFFDVGIGQVDIGFINYNSINYFVILSYILILLGFLFLQNISNKYENKVLFLMDNLKIKNSELQQQKEEIVTQRDEIASQKDLVIKQKEHIEEIHKSVTDSINYAKRIQTSTLPNIMLLGEYFSDLFILFKPKDVVSGDFYWFAKIENQIVVTVADCTGHGVPGAFMSMLGMSLLKEIVINEYITQPDIILKRLRKEIIKALGQTGISGEQKDGMDISLCSINLETLEMQWSGANNPCLIIRDDKILELKADKMPIAIYEKMDKFNLQELKLQKNDIIYLSSDGYHDQFGGPDNKKFMSTRFKDLLLTISSKPVAEQKEIIDKTMEEWKNRNVTKYEQTDDITVMGIKI